MRPSEQISLRPSRSLAVALGVIHSCGGACLLPLTLSVWVKLMLAAALLGSFAVTMRGSVLLLPARSITQLNLSADGTLEFVQRDGHRVKAEIAAQTSVFPFLAAIAMKVSGKRGARLLVILPDMLGYAEFRRLRVWLRWRAGFSRGAV